jgi:hypothetical protein
MGHEISYTLSLIPGLKSYRMTAGSSQTTALLKSACVKLQLAERIICCWFSKPAPLLRGFKYVIGYIRSSGQPIAQTTARAKLTHL